jgi:molybdenum cofactor biosynthesis enzyme MoaA
MSGAYDGAISKEAAITVFAPSRRRNQAVPMIRSTNAVYQPEDSPFQTIQVDVTHRCNMRCKNCYIPNRDIPDLNAKWIYSILARLPHRTRIRLVGAEPTVRADLPEIISEVRRLGHIPIVMTNGLKLVRRDYVRRLKEAGCRTVYLSMNGGLDDDVYEGIDNMRCASQKLAALDNLCEERFYISLGMILVRGVNEFALGPFYEAIRSRRQVYELHLRSVGAQGEYMKEAPYTLPELRAVFERQTGVSLEGRPIRESGASYVDVMIGRLKLQLTQWPDLGSTRRGRLSPDGTIQPAMEHGMANAGGY